jgi:hypothetical protein
LPNLLEVSDHRPCDSRRYMEWAEYTPDGSSAQKTWSSSVCIGCKSKILHRFSHSTVSSNPKFLLNRMRHPLADLTPATVAKWLSQQAKRYLILCLNDLVHFCLSVTEPGFENCQLKYVHEYFGVCSFYSGAVSVRFNYFLDKLECQCEP